MKSISFGKKAKRIMLIAMLILLALILLLISVLLIMSPGTVKPKVDGNGNEIVGSVSEKTFIEINGAELGMFIRGEDTSNPVILFLHGGPGMPEYFLAEKYLTELEKHFTICYLEQRGTGLSYSSDLDDDAITTDQAILDAVETTDYLRERFDKEKIYLLAQSYGTFIGIQLASQYPQLFHAYVGIAQVSNQSESEKLAYTYMLEEYKKQGNTKMVERFENYAIYESEEDFETYLNSSLREEALHKLGVGTMRDMDSVITGIFLPVMGCSAYTLSEKINIWRGKAFLNHSTNLGDDSFIDLTETITELEIPTYFISGVYDYNVSCALAKEYLNKLQAQIKGFYTFKKSAHSPLFEEQELFVQIMTEDVLNAKVAFADD